VGEAPASSAPARGAPYRGSGLQEGLRGDLPQAQRRLARLVVIEGALLVGTVLLASVPVMHRATASDFDARFRAPEWRPWDGFWDRDHPPILVDVNDDGHEDILGIRWFDKHQDGIKSILVVATDGKTLATLWRTAPYPVAWEDPQERLVKSGDEVVLWQSGEGGPWVHRFELRTGREIGVEGTPSVIRASVPMTGACPDVPPCEPALQWDREQLANPTTDVPRGVQIDWLGGRIIRFCRPARGVDQLSAFDVSNGSRLWQRDLREAGMSSFNSMTVTAQGVYVTVQDSLWVFDAPTGGKVGTVP
jgi:hypothetical protein